MCPKCLALQVCCKMKTSSSEVFSGAGWGEAWQEPSMGLAVLGPWAAVTRLAAVWAGTCVAGAANPEGIGLLSQGEATTALR